MAEKIAGRGAVVQVDTEASPLLAQRFQIRGIPALHILRGGSSVASLSGARSLESILSWFRSHGGG